MTEDQHRVTPDGRIDESDPEAVLHTPEPVPEPPFASIPETPIPLDGGIIATGLRLTRMIRGSARFLVRRWRWLMVAAILVGGVEAATRAIAPEYANRVYSDRLTGGHPIQMSRQLHRGPDVAERPAPGVIRIIGLGDSVTYGTGVPADATWPRRLLDHLPQPPGLKVESLAAGLPGSGLSQVTRVAREHWADFEPDLFVVQASPNMVSRALIFRGADLPIPVPSSVDPSPEPTGARAVADRLKRAVQGLALPGLLKINLERLLHRTGMLGHRVDPDAPFGPLLAHGWRQADLRADAWTDAWAAFEAELDDLQATAASLGIPLIVVGTPSRFTISDELRDNLRFVPTHRLQAEFCRRLGDLCDQRGISYVNGEAILRRTIQDARRDGGRRPAFFIIDDMTHLDPDGHDAIARAVAQEVLRGARIGPADPDASTRPPWSDASGQN